MLTVTMQRPSALDAAETAAWRAMQAATPSLRRAFLSPGFARACETAHGRARVAVLREDGTATGFLAFQFASLWHQCAGLGERIGGDLNDAAGLVAPAGVKVQPAWLLRRCRLGALFMQNLAPGQTAFGLPAEAGETGHVIDLPHGGAACLAALRPEFARDTQRRLRRAEREAGPLRFSFDAEPDAAAALAVIEQKRQQYRRTGVPDPFANPDRLRLIAALCEAPAPDCRPVLATLCAGGRVLARHLGLMCHDVLSYWFPVYDPAAEKLSPGRLLLWHQIAAAERCGVALIDRGAGDSAAKRDFSTATQQFATANWSARTPRALLARGAQALAWRLG